MSTDYAEPSGVPPAAAVKPKNSFERLAGALFAPAETFQDVARRPDVLVPLLLFIIIGFVTTALTVPKMDMDALMAEQAAQIKRQNPNVTDADVERMSGFIKGSTLVAAWTAPLLAAIWWLILAGILLLAFRLMGGEGTYKQALSAVLYAWVPLFLFGLVLTIVILARGDFDPLQMATIVKSNPAFLVDMKEQPVLFAVLSSLDLFTIWTVVLLIIGFAALSRMSYGKSAAIVLSLWVVQVLMKIGFAAMNAARMSA